MIDAGKTVQQLFEKHGVTRIKVLTHESAGVVAVVLVGALPNFDESRWGSLLDHSWITTTSLLGHD